MQKIALVALMIVFLAGCSTLQRPISPTDTGSGATTEEKYSPDLWRQTLNSLSPINQAREAELVFTNPRTTPAIKEKAAYVIATRPGSMILYVQQLLAKEYANASVERRAYMERMLLEEVKSLPTDYIRDIASVTPRVQETTFPWIVFVYEAAYQGLLLDNIGTLARIGHPQFFANPSIFGIADGSETQTAELPEGVVINPNPRFNNSCVTLVLPLSGNFATIGQHIADGAIAAQKTIGLQNVNIVVNLIDSEDPSWLTQLGSLPATCTVVGGPLRTSILEQAKNSGVMGQKAFFPFMSQLPEGYTEGQDIWRFFTSTQDQVSVLLDFVVNDLGIIELGSIYPHDSYGTRMNEIFESTAGKTKIKSIYSMSYPLDDVKAWTKSVGEFLESRPGGKSKLPIITAPIGAIFLPDSWSNMEMLASIIHYHGGVYLPLLGTTLWEQSLSNIDNLQTNYFDLAVFPTAYNPNSRMYGALQLQNNMNSKGLEADDWSALGYDFVQTIAASGLEQGGIDSFEVNRKLSSLQKLAWAGAPFAWSVDGKATRKLFLFQPDVTGMKELNIEEFKEKMLKR